MVPRFHGSVVVHIHTVIYMYIAWIQIHGTAELWKRSDPCICTFYESRFMELQNHGYVTHACIFVFHEYVYCMNPYSWNRRTMEMWWTMYAFIAWIQIHGTAELRKCGETYICILHESIFMEPQNHGNVVTHVYVFYESRFMEPQNRASVVTHVCICILHESRFMELQNCANMVTHVYVFYEYTYIVYRIYGTM